MNSFQAWLNAKIDVAGAPVRALQAGVDVLLYTSERGSRPGYEDLLRAARAGALSRATLEAANVRIAVLKRWLWGA
jgi:beta-glucosidase-like glycosyl hydrolase